MALMNGWRLEGGGPWRIVEECVASRHCTLYAGKHGCICPRARSLYEKDLIRMRRISKEYRGRLTEGQRQRSESPAWFKGGPWRIAEECLALGHNNLAWARGTNRDSGGVRCVCPHAVWLMEQYTANRRKPKEVQPPRKRMGYAAALPLAAVPEPDWSRSACSKDVGTAEGGFNEDVSKRGMAERQAAKDLCGECPLSVFRECGAWIVAKEGIAPGSLGGVYAGKDRWNRQGVQLAMVGQIIKRVRLDSAKTN